jgi:Mlc titration factor MtfA (ptsG expression regulator)
MTEAFFQIPHHLREIYPHVYEQLERYYKQDPIQRRPPVAHLQICTNASGPELSKDLSRRPPALG